MFQESSSPQPDFSPAAESSPSVRHRKVAIIGFGRTAKDCPWQDPTWELWTMNGFWRAAEPDFGVKAPEERYTLWFDTHSIEYTREYGVAAGIAGKQEAWLKQEHPFPIFMLEENPEFPSVVRFPIEDLIAKVGRDYFTSTVAYALAFALANKDSIAEVSLFGIDLTHATEYADQKPCAEYWIGRLEGAGVKVTIHEESALLSQRGRYGYENPNPLAKELTTYVRKQVGGIEKVMSDNQEKLSGLQAQMHTDDGARQALLGVIDRLEVWGRGGKV